MTPSESVRHYFVSEYLIPAKSKGIKRFSVRAGDVHGALRFHNRVPAVCQALQSEKLLTENGLRIVEKTGPPSGLSTTVTFTYEIVDQTSDVKADFIKQFFALRGAAKGLYPQGGEAYLKSERKALDEALARKIR